jgi:hypothetical protein
MKKITLIILLTVFLMGCFLDDRELTRELTRTAFDAGWWCNESGKSNSECMEELNNLSTMMQ